MLRGLVDALSASCRTFLYVLDGRYKTSALTIFVKRVPKRFPVDQEFQMFNGGSFTMRMGISDSVHYAATGAVDISCGMLFARGADAELFPRSPI
jgi:hypothetical protein